MFEDLVTAEQKVLALLESKTIHGLIFIGLPIGKTFINKWCVSQSGGIICGMKL